MELSKHNTEQECRAILSHCRELFEKKLHDYGSAWRILRPESLTDQIYIKAERIRSLQINGYAAVDEGVEPEFVGIINYGIIGMLQLMRAKNHDYGEVWRNMRGTSMTDLILSKVHRTKQIEDLRGETFVSEGIEANYMDMVNYALFCLIKLNSTEA